MVNLDKRCRTNAKTLECPFMLTYIDGYGLVSSIYFPINRSNLSIISFFSFNIRSYKAIFSS